MTGDAFRKVLPGQQLAIPAEAYNSFVEAAQSIRNKQDLAQLVATWIRQSGIIKVRNQSGSDLDRFSVLGVDSSVVKPADNLLQFKNQVALDGVVPDEDQHIGKFVVLFETLAAGSIGRERGGGPARSASQRCMRCSTSGFQSISKRA